MATQAPRRCVSLRYQPGVMYRAHSSMSTSDPHARERATRAEHIVGHCSPAESDTQHRAGFRP